MYPKPLRLLIACWMIAVVWGLLALFLPALFIGVAGVASEVMMPLAAGSIMGVFVLIPMQIIVTLGLRCPACNGYVTMETFGPFHPAARITTMGGRYAAVVLDVLRERRFTCMYCGREHRVDPRHAEAPSHGMRRRGM